MKLRNFKALTFDCYGTLIDWESGMLAALEPLTTRLDPAPARDEILELHAYFESAQQLQTPSRLYPDLLAVVYRRMAERWGITPSWAECRRYGRSIPNWPAFPDSVAALQYLKQHYKLAILSNVDQESFSASNARLQVEFDAVYTAEDIGAYKPADANFEYMLGRLGELGLARSDVLHTAESLFHDHVPARRHGLSTCWIYRRHAQPGFGATRDPGQVPQIDFQFNSLAEMAAAHQAEMTG